MATPTFVAGTGSSSLFNADGSGDSTLFSALDLSNCDLAIVVVATQPDGTAPLIVGGGSSSDWVQLLPGTTNSSGWLGAVFYKMRPGASETLVVGNSGSSGNYTLYRINGANNIAGVLNLASTSYNPISYDAGAVRDHLWVSGIFGTSASSSSGFLGSPSGYSNKITSTANLPHAAIASKAVAASQTEDPSAWSGLSSTQNNRTGTWTLATWYELPSSACNPDNCTSAGGVDSPALTLHSVVTPDNVVLAETTSSPTLVIVIQPNTASSSHSVSQAFSTAHVSVTPAAASSSNAASQPTLAFKASLQPANAVCLSTLSAPTRLWHIALQPASGTLLHSTTAPSVQDKYALTPNGGQHLGVLTQPSTRSHSIATPANALLPATATTPTLAHRYAAQPSSGNSPATLTSPTLIAHSVTTPASLSLLSFASTPTTTPSAAVAVNDNLKPASYPELAFDMQSVYADSRYGG